MALQVLVVGGGRVGAELATLLLRSGHHVDVVELASDRAAALREELPAAVVSVGDGTDPSVLEAAGVRRADVVVAVTGEDARNLVVGSLARAEFEVPRTIARVVDPAHAWAFGPDLGIDVALDQAELLARLTLEEMSLGEVATLVKLRRGALTLVEERLAPGASAAGRTIGALAFPPTCLLLAVLRGDEVLRPTVTERLAVGDEVLALVHEGEVAAFAAALDGGGADRDHDGGGPAP
jgi:trk system potassium uptake protein